MLADGILELVKLALDEVLARLERAGDNRINRNVRIGWWGIFF